MAIHGNMMAYMIFTGANKTKQLVYDLHSYIIISFILRRENVYIS